MYMLPVSLCDLVASKHRLFDRVHAAVGKHMNVLLAAVVIVLVAVVRQALVMFDVPNVGIREGVFAFLFIYSAVIVVRRLNWALLTGALTWLGRHSMNLWYLHGIFFVGVGRDALQHILYFPGLSVLILAWGVLLLCPVTLACDYVQRRLLAWLKL